MYLFDQSPVSQMFQASYTKLSHYGISLVIPVLNERENVDILIKQIMVLPVNDYTQRIKEIIFVDDGSNDGTAERIKYLSEIYTNIPIVVIERSVKSGTVNAQLCGISAARYDNVLIMDGDLQHPVEYIDDLVEKYTEGYDFVLGSRYIIGGSVNRTPVHGAISRGATVIAKIMLPWTRRLSDPISGFFIVNKNLITNSHDITGFNKLSLYILSTRKKISVAEVPFKFIERANGRSKVASDGVNFMLRFISELRYYRYLRKISKRGTSVSSTSSKNGTFWNH